MCRNVFIFTIKYNIQIILRELRTRTRYENHLLLAGSHVRQLCVLIVKCRCWICCDHLLPALSGQAVADCCLYTIQFLDGLTKSLINVNVAARLLVVLLNATITVFIWAVIP